jgi:hypothetical protein
LINLSVCDLDDDGGYSLIILGIMLVCTSLYISSFFLLISSMHYKYFESLSFIRFLGFPEISPFLSSPYDGVPSSILYISYRFDYSEFTILLFSSFLFCKDRSDCGWNSNPIKEELLDEESEY